MNSKPSYQELEERIRFLENSLKESKQIQEVMRISEEVFRNLVDSSPVAMVLFQDNRWVYANQTVKTLSGYSLDSIFSMDHIEMVHPDYRDQFTNECRKFLSDEKSVMNEEIKIISGDGNEKWISFSGKPMQIGNRDARLISVIDITKLKQVEEALRLSEEKYRLLVETASDVIFTMDENLRITYISPSVMRLRGYTVDEAMSQSINDILTPESYKTAVKIFTEEMDNEKAGTKNNNRIRVLELDEYCRDGSVIRTESIFNSIRDKENRFIGLLGITRDISERKQAEEERKMLISEREDALSRVKVLNGMLPICASCKKIRDDKGYWSQLETYIKYHSEANFTHGICPDCADKLYPDLDKD